MEGTKKIIIVTSHPVQYNAPFFKYLSTYKEIDLLVIYSFGRQKKKWDSGFKRYIEWNIDLNDGYRFAYAKNICPFIRSRFFFSSIVPGLSSFVLSEKPAAIIIYGWSYFSHLFLMSRLRNKINVLFFGDSTLERRHEIFFKRKLLKLILSFPKCILYAGNENREYYRRLCPAKTKHIFFPHAIDADRFKKSYDASEYLRSQYKLKDDDFIYMYAGKLEKNKNISFLIQSFQKAGLSKSKLFILGSGAEENRLKFLSNNHPNIFFIGFVNQSTIPDFYHLASCIVLPSLHETWGLVINEAIAANKPVIVSNKCGCCSDLVINGINGYSFNPARSDDLIAALRNVKSLDLKKLHKVNDSINRIYSFRNRADTLIAALHEN